MRRDSNWKTARTAWCAALAGVVLAAGTMNSSAASAADAQACEGNNAVFELNTGFPPNNWSYRWSYGTASGSATNGTDFASVSGKLVFNSGEYTKSVSVATYKDTVNEGTESFVLKFSGFETKDFLRNTSGWVSTDPSQFYGMPPGEFDMDGAIVNRDSITGNCG